MSIKISGSGSGSAIGGGPRRTGKSDGTKGGFKQALVDAMDGTDGPTRSEAPASLAGIDALLLVQSVDDSTEREARRRMIRRGEDILDALEELRMGLLLGSIPKEKLEKLAQTIRNRRETCSDPRLGALLDEIELRAEVELAKLSRGS